MLDINLIRKNPEIVLSNLKKRQDNEKVKWIDDILKKDKEILILKKEIDELRHQRNIVSQKINELKKQKKTAVKEIKQAQELPKKIEFLEKKQEKINEIITNYLMRLPNILHKSVPYGKDENDNQEIKRVGKIKTYPEL